MSINVSEESILEALHKIPNEHWVHVLDFLHHLEPTVSRPPEGQEPNRWTIAELLALPPEKRDAILEAQAALAEHDYRNDPELTIGEPVA
jgi:hypothetical protein